MEPALVSIIIPHFNRAEVIQQTLQSVFDQTLTSWEVVIVDDHSDNEQFKLLEKTVNHKQITITKRHGSIKGPSACRNQGAKEAKGKYLLFLDSDDLLAPYCLQQRVTAMEKNPKLGFGVFLMQEFSFTPGDSDKVFNLQFLQKEKHLSSFIENVNPWNVTCPIWNRDYFISIGGFDVNLFYMEDPELHVRALLDKTVAYETFYEPPPDSFYRVNYHDAAKNGFYENSIKYRIVFYKKTWDLIKSSAMPEKTLNTFKYHIKVGLMNTLNHFILSRITEYTTYFDDMYSWAKEQEVLAEQDLLKLRLIKYIWINDNILIKFFKLKGLSRKMLVN